MDYSIIVPCRNEGGNVEWLAERILRSLSQETSFEIIFVDDSDDDTTQRLDRLCQAHARIRYVHRINQTGLGTAIVDGFHMSAGQWLIVMDADLQHPPESLPALLAEIRKGTADLIIPSRFVPGGSDGGLNIWRKLVSWTARMMAKAAFHRVRHVADPTSGYFAVRRETAFSRPLDPIGWKILLELLVCSDYDNVREIPYTFMARDLGSSKFNLREQWRYIKHLLRLIKSSEADFRFWKFCLVGTSGVVINSACFIPLVHVGMKPGAAFAVAALIAMLNNFVWNNLFTWNFAKRDPIGYRMIKFLIVSTCGLILSSMTVELLHSRLHVHYLIAGCLGIAVSTVWNFTLHNLWTFKNRASSPNLQAAANVMQRGFDNER